MGCLKLKIKDTCRKFHEVDRCGVKDVCEVAVDGETGSAVYKLLNVLISMWSIVIRWNGYSSLIKTICYVFN